MNSCLKEIVKSLENIWSQTKFVILPLLPIYFICVCVLSGRHVAYVCVGVDVSVWMDCALIYKHSEVKAGYLVSSVALCFAALRQGLSLNEKLGV